MLKKVGGICRCLTIICFCVFSCSQIFSQNITSIYPEILHSDFSNIPTAVRRLDPEMSGFANCTHHRFINLLNDVYLVNFTGFFRVANRHQLGVLLYGDKEGPYISKYRFNLHYAYQIQYSEDGLVSLGGSAGLVSLQYDGNKSGVVSRAIVPDLGIDFLVRKKTFFLSVLANQVSSRQIKPLYSGINLRRYYELLSGIAIPVGVEWELRPQTRFVFYNNQLMSIPDQYGAILLLNKNIVSGGIGTYNFNTMIFQVALNWSDIQQMDFSLYGSYKMASGKKPLNNYANSWEIGINVSKKKVNDVHI